MADPLCPVVLAGGSGTRFWPASRRDRPKPFISLLGRHTLFDQTLERLRAVGEPRHTAVVASDALAPLVRKALRAHPGVGLAVEPEPRDTMAAIALAAAWAAARVPDGLVGIFPADHYIPRMSPFVRSVTAAARAAADGENLVLIGIEPTRPDSAYGYLRLEPGRRRGAARVVRFVEKPSRARAKRLASDGDYLWNAGMVVARPARILAETRSCAPQVWEALGEVLERMATGRRVTRAQLTAGYEAAPKISFDYAVLEHSSRVRAVRGRFPWSDLGSWDALARHLPEVTGNRSRDPQRTLALKARGNTVWASEGKQVVLLGVEGLVIVDTPDALLVCDERRAQEVRCVAAELDRRGAGDLT